MLQTLLLCGLASVLLAQDGPVVDTIYGSVRGTAIELSSGITINSFLGIPIATPPVGDLRFEPPQEPAAWDGIYDALEPADACIQVDFGQITRTHNGWTRFSEDCLYANIYSPEGASNLPVLVYMHGGGYQEGSNFGHPGYFLAEKEVVVMTITYRMGILGYASTGDDVIPGNMGLLDQVLALQFVQNNIANFGGNPNQVTISGESAGGSSSGLLMMTPFAQDLFHGAILQSGNELSPWAIAPPGSNPESYLTEVAQKLGCPIDSSQAMVDCLRTIDAVELSNTTFSCTLGYLCLGFQPIVDGAIIPDTPLQLRKNGEYTKVPEMIGLTEDDYNFYTKKLPGIDDGLNRTEYDTVIETLVDYWSEQWPIQNRTAEDVIQALRFYYTDWPYVDDTYRNRDMLGKMTTDEMFGFGADTQAKMHSRDGSEVYFYIFDYKMSNSEDPEWMGVCHVDDLYPEFGWPFMAENEAAFSHSQANPSFNITNYSSLDEEFTDFFLTLWTNFAKYGNPTPDPVEGPSNTSVTWFSFNEEALNYIHLKETSEMKIDYRQKNYAFWTEYINYMAYGGIF